MMKIADIKIFLQSEAKTQTLASRFHGKLYYFHSYDVYKKLKLKTLSS